MTLNLKKYLAFLILISFSGSSLVLASIGGISITVFRILFLVLLFFYVQEKFKKKFLKLNKKVIQIGGFMLILVMGTILFSPNVKMWFNGFINLFIDIMMVVFIVEYTDTKKDLQMYLHMFTVGCFVTILISCFEYVTKIHLFPNYAEAYLISDWEYQYLNEAPTAMLYNPNNVASVLVLGIPLVYFFISEKSKQKKLKKVIYICLNFLVCFMTGSRSGMLFSIIAIGYLYYLENKKNNISYRKIISLFIAISCILLFILVSKDFIIQQLKYAGVLDQNSHLVQGFAKSNERIEIIEKMFEMIGFNLIVGIGPYGAETLVGSFVHNFWIETIINYGIIVGVIVVLLYAFQVVYMWKHRRHDREGTAIFIMLLMYSVVVMVPPTIYTLPGLWLVWGYTFAYKKIKSGEVKSEKKSIYNYN